MPGPYREVGAVSSTSRGGVKTPPYKAKEKRCNPKRLQRFTMYQ